MPKTKADWIALEETAEQRLFAQPTPTVRYDVPSQWEGDPKYDPVPHSPSLHAGEGVHGPVKALLVTALLGEPCQTYAGNWVNVVSLKNKRDFAQMHHYGFYWSTEHLDDELYGPMNKIAILRYLAYRYKDSPLEWFWWLDQDTLFANMTQDVPWRRYGDADMVLWTPWGKEKMLQRADAEALNSGVVLFRNNDWTRALLDLMAKYARGNWWGEGKVAPSMYQELMTVISGFQVALYEQNIIAYLFKKHAQLRDHVFFEDTDAWLANEQPGFHTHFKFDYSMAVMHSEKSEWMKLPLLVHYAGCQFCGLALNEGWAVECMTHFIVIHDFARNQSAKTLGFELTPLNRTEIYLRLASHDAILQQHPQQAAAWLSDPSTEWVSAMQGGVHGDHAHHVLGEHKAGRVHGRGKDNSGEENTAVDRRQLVDDTDARMLPRAGRVVWF